MKIPGWGRALGKPVEQQDAGAVGRREIRRWGKRREGPGVRRAGGLGRGARPARSPVGPPRSSTGVVAASPSGPLEFPCGSGKGAPRGWRCDGGQRCPDGSDEGPGACGESGCSGRSSLCAQRRAPALPTRPSRPHTTDPHPLRPGEHPAREGLRTAGLRVSFELFHETLPENLCPPSQARQRE